MHTVSKTTNTLENLLQMGRDVQKKEEEEEKIYTDPFFSTCNLLLLLLLLLLILCVCSILEHVGSATA
jgi:hypothetical protein